MIAMDAGLVLTGAVLLTLIVAAVATCLIPEPDVNCGVCGGTRHYRGGSCPRCNASPEC